MVACFTRESQAALAQAAEPRARKEIYLDTHTIAVHTEKPVAQTKHSLWNRVVKALVKIRTISATLVDLISLHSDMHFSFDQ